MNDQRPARQGRSTHVPPAQDGDPTRMRNQPALRTPKRWIWIVPALLLAAAAITAFILCMPINLALAWIGIAFVVASSIALVTTAFLVPNDRTRNLTMAGLMVIMAAMSLILLLAILWAAQLPRA
ncbi:hypothetical protein [Microbacterium sp. NPDC096154]|uniref:hypothetical protein n=1 Tax=Microbacterium sp. NPDC096154 TaxID=3155549 RepID=UPI00331E3E26